VIYYLKNDSRELPSGRTSKPYIEYYFDKANMRIIWIPGKKRLFMERLKARWFKQKATYNQLHSLIRFCWKAEEYY